VLIAQLVGAGIGGLLNVELLRRRASLDTTHISGIGLLRAAIRPSFQSYLSMLFALALFRADIFIVERLGGGLRSAGLYSVAIFAAELILKVPQWASGVLTASVAMESSQGPRRTVTLFVGSLVAAMICMLPLLFLSRIDSLLTAILGKDYHGIALLMLALGPRIIMQAGTTILAANLAGRGFTWYHPSACAAGMVAVIALDLLLVPRYGALGAAVGSSIGYSAAAILMLRGFLILERMTFGDFVAVVIAVSRERLSSPWRRLSAASVTGGPSLPL
jgi:O-antigen/teichoic acid export membrane protein